MVAAAMSEMGDINLWSGELVDSIILAGNALFVDLSTGKFFLIPILNGSQIYKIISPPKAHYSKNFDLRDNITKLHIASAEIESMMLPCFDSKIDETALLTALKEMFGRYNQGYVSLQQDFFTVIKNSESFYLFDPRGMAFPCKKKPSSFTQRACVYKFETLQKLTEQLHNLLLDLSVCLSSKDSVFMVGGIMLSSNLKKPMPAKAKPLKKKSKADR